MQRTIILMALAATVVPLAAADSYGDCDSKGSPALGIVEVLDVLYVDDRGYVAGNGVWIYLESNGEERLQRGGCPMLDFAMCEGADPCSDDSANGPDTLVF